MIGIIDIEQRIEFVSKDDNTEPKTVFVLRPLSGADMIDLSQFAEDGVLNLKGDYLINMIDKSTVEIKNINSALPKRKIIESLPVGVITELVAKVGEINNLTEQDRKNS